MTNRTFEEKRTQVMKLVQKLCPSLHEAAALTHIVDAVFISHLNAHEQLGVMTQRKAIRCNLPKIPTKRHGNKNV